MAKDQQIYLMGMEHALKVAKEYGVDELEREVRYRSINPLPLNVSRLELTTLARLRASEELMFVAVSMSKTLIDHMKMPPSVIIDYLRYFNDMVDVYRMNPEQFKADQDKLAKNHVMNEMCKSFLKEDKKDEN